MNQQARLDAAKAEPGRVRSLAEHNVVSKQELDGIANRVRSAEMAVMAAHGQVQTARVNLESTTITAPVSCLPGYVHKAEGSYVAPGADGLLATLSLLDPIEVNVSIPEDEWRRWREELMNARLRAPPGDEYEIELMLPDGVLLPRYRGRISFAKPSFRRETKTFLRVEIANHRYALRAGEFIRAKVRGAVRPSAIVVPQRAIVQGPRHFVWVVNEHGKAEERIVEPGDWIGTEWIVNSGLEAGERIVVDGAIHLTRGTQLDITEVLPASPLDAARHGQR